jgi:hypothetical protein
MIAAITLAAVLVAGCGEGEMEREPRTIEEVLASETDRWMSVQGVQGTALGLCGDEPCIVIYASDPAVRESIAEQVEGYRIDVRVTGEFRALDSIPEAGTHPED